MEWRQIRGKTYFPPVFLPLLPVALLLVLIVLNPVPLVGGYTDDFKYLVGAQCLDCIPTNHWERRFAIVWPTGLAIYLFGLNLWSVMLVPVASAIIVIVLAFNLVRQQYDYKVATVAAIVLVLTPVFSERSMRVGIDMVELAFLVGAVSIIQFKKNQFWAGVLMALAVLCRPTQLAATPLVALLAWHQHPAGLKLLAAGFVLPIMGELAVYFVAIGDPLYPWKLSWTHMQAWRASMDNVSYANFISPQVNTSESPLFNTRFIGGWIPSSGVEAHWTVQGIVNLLISPECGVLLSSAALLSLLSTKRLDKRQLILIASAVFYFGVLTYGFAVDPRPRMFLPVILISSVLVGSLAMRSWTWPRSLVPPVFLLLIGVVGISEVADRINYRSAALKADKLMNQHPYLVTPNARQRMALIRQDFPTGGRDLIEIDDLCPILKQGLWLHSVDDNLCIYRQSLPTNQAMHRLIEAVYFRR